MWCIANNERTGIPFPVRHVENTQTISLFVRHGPGEPTCPGAWPAPEPAGLRSLRRAVARILPCHRANVRTAAHSGCGRRENHDETVVADRRGLRADTRRCAGDRREP